MQLQNGIILNFATARLHLYKRHVTLLLELQMLACITKCNIFLF